MTNNKISSLMRGLQILKCFTQDKPKLTLTELSKMTEINKASVQRYTNTLLDAGFLERDESKRFRLGQEILLLGISVSRNNDIRELAYPLLKQLAETTNQTVNLSIPSNTEVVIIERIEIKKVMEYDIKIGYKLPVYCSSTGKAYLAFLPTEERDRIIDSIKFEKFTDYTIVDKKSLIMDMESTKKRGYSIQKQELSLTACSIGAPVFSSNGKVVAAVSIAVNISEQSLESLNKNIAPKVVQLAKNISKLLGWVDHASIY